MRVARGGSGAKAPPLAARPKLAGLGGRFLMIYRNNTGRLAWVLASSMCLKTRWLGHFGGFMSRDYPVNVEAEF